jgi:hypothetical protein
MSSPSIVTRQTASRRCNLKDGRAIHILGGGHMANLAGPRPLGNSVESMDLGFTLQVALPRTRGKAWRWPRSLRRAGAGRYRCDGGQQPIWIWRDRRAG